MNQSLIRAVLKIGAGYFIARGFTDDSTAEIIISGLVALFGVIWGVVHRSEGKIANPLPALILAFATIAAFATFARNAAASDVYGAPPPVGKPATALTARDTITANPELFRAGELSVDGGTYLRSADLKSYAQGALYGANWFPWQTIGFTAEARMESLAHSAIDGTAFGVIGRIPLDKIHLAPQFGLGADYDFEANHWSVYASGGAEFRFNPHAGVVAEIRGYRPNEVGRNPSAKEFLMGVVKVRATF